MTIKENITNGMAWYSRV